MEALKACSFPSFYLNMTSTRQARIQFYKPILNLSPNGQPNSSLHPNHNPKARFKLYTAISTPASTELTDPPKEETEIEKKDEKFDWYSHWYPIMPVCDLDKRRPHGKRVIGLDVVVWWDRNENAWKVFDDSCPHRLAPLSEGRIDQWGRLQCVYHGWCFGGSGDCKLIPQAPRDKPPVHTSKQACVVVYPSCVQNGIVWFWPNSDPQYKDIILTRKPPYIPEMDDPSYTKATITRDIQYGYEVLIENLMDPAHVPYAHYGILPIPRRKDSVKVDREGGRPLDMNIKKLDINGFIAKQDAGENFFIPPCLFYGYFNASASPSDGPASSTRTTERPSSKVQPKRSLLVFLCVPVSPGNSRMIFASPRNFAVWLERIFPRWFFHLGQNLILDSDLYLLHVEERKLKEIGPTNWHKACYVPTKSDALVVSFRRWLNKYAGGQLDWGTKFGDALPSTPPREQLLDRYWSHTVKCQSCSVAYKGLNALEIALQVVSIASIGIVAAAKQGMLSMAARTSLVSVAIICFLASRWLSHFVYKNFHFHDYDHAFR